MDDAVGKTRIRPDGRRKDGVPVPGHDVVTADLLALVAGVNFNSAVKFLLALNAISKVLNTPMDVLAREIAIPLDPADPARYRGTSDVAERLVKSHLMQGYEDELHFLERMSRK